MCVPPGEDDVQKVPDTPAVQTLPAASALLGSHDIPGVSTEPASDDPRSAVAEHSNRVEALLKLAESCPPLFQVCLQYSRQHLVCSVGVTKFTEAWCFRRCKRSG